MFIKTILFSFILMGLSAVGFADQGVSLEPGTAVIIEVGEKTEVYCQSTPELPKCKIIYSPSTGFYLVYSGETYLGRHGSKIDSALETVKKLKDTGVCR